MCDVGKIHRWSQNCQWLRDRTGSRSRNPRPKIGHKLGSAWQGVGGGYPRGPVVGSRVHMDSRAHIDTTKNDLAVGKRQQCKGKRQVLGKTRVRKRVVIFSFEPGGRKQKLWER